MRRTRHWGQDDHRGGIGWGGAWQDGENHCRRHRDDDPDNDNPGGGEDVALGNVRPTDGTASNPDNPDFGATGQQLLRLAEAGFADGIGAMVDDRPDPRTISNTLFQQEGPEPNSAGASDFLWAWGQFIDHDLDLTSGGRTEPAPIPVPAGDPFFDPQGTGAVTIRFNRAVPIEGTGETTPREFANEITSFIDASMIYGSDAEIAASLRVEGGKLILDENGLLVPKEGGGLLAGDSRAQENVALQSLQALFAREHNRLVDELAARDPTLTDDELYQAARQRVEAQIQAITYNEFLPLLVGENALAAYQGFDASVNPAISIEFSTAVFRLGHSMLSPTIQRLDENGQTISSGDLTLRAANGAAPSVIAENGGLEALFRGLGDGTAQELDTQMVEDVRSFLFGAPGAGGIDLASVNIQRGRDLGLPGYNDLREALGLGRVETFADITSDPALAAELEALYGDVDSVDLWVGGLSEDHVEGGLVGELFANVLIDQFQRVRDGDPFWSQLSDLPQEELDALWSTSLSDVIVRNTDIDVFQDQAFLAFDRVSGGEQRDELIGGEGRDLLIGLGGKDRLEGGAGDDQFVGGDGNDVMIGGLGNDIFEGGKGRDVFVIASGEGNDVIKDFSSRKDVVDLSAAGFASFNDLVFEADDGGVVLALEGGGTVTFEGLTLDDLDEDNFLVSA